MNYLLWTSIAVLLAILQGTTTQQAKPKAAGDDLCKHSFHSYLCNAPKSSGRRRVYNGQIQGPPPPPIQNVLVGANTFPQGSRLRPDKPKEIEQPNLIPDTSNVFQAEVYLPPTGASPPPPDRIYLGDNSNLQSQALLPPREKSTRRPTPTPRARSTTPQPITARPTPPVTYKPYVRPTTTKKPTQGSNLLGENTYLPPVKKVFPPAPVKTATKRPVPTTVKPIYDPDIQPDGAQNPSVSLRPDDSQKSHGCKHAFHSFLCDQPSAGSKRRNYNGQRQGSPQQNPNVIGQNSFLQPSKVLPPTSAPLFADNSFIQSVNLKPNAITYLPPPPKTPKYVPTTTPRPPPPTTKYIPPTTRRPPPTTPKYIPPTTPRPPPPTPKYLPPTTPKSVPQPLAYLPPKPEKPDPNLIGGDSFLDASRLPPPTRSPGIKKTVPKPRPEPDIAPDAAQNPSVQIRPNQPEDKSNNCGHPFHSFLCDAPKSGGRRRPYNGRKPEAAPQNTNFIGENSFPQSTKVAPPQLPQAANVAPVRLPLPTTGPTPYPYPAKAPYPAFTIPTTRVPLLPQPANVTPVRLPLPTKTEPTPYPYPAKAPYPAFPIPTTRAPLLPQPANVTPVRLPLPTKTEPTPYPYPAKAPYPAFTIPTTRAPLLPQPANVTPVRLPLPTKPEPTPYPYPAKAPYPAFTIPTTRAPISGPTPYPYPAKAPYPAFPIPTTRAPLVADNSFLLGTQLRPKENTYLPPPPPTPKDTSPNTNLFGDNSFLDPTKLRPPVQNQTPSPIRKTTSYEPAPQPDEAKNIAAHAFHSFLYQKPKSGGRRIYNGQRPSRSPQHSDGLTTQSKRVARQVAKAATPAAADAHDHHHDDHHGDHHGGHGDHHHDHHHHHVNITLEQLCRDPFHAFLCDPVDTSRRQLYDGEPYTPSKRGRSKGKLFGASSVIQTKRVRPEPNSLIAGFTNPKDNSDPEAQILRKEQKLAQNVPSFYQSTTQNVPSFYQSTTQNVPSFYQSTTQKVPSFYQSTSQNVPRFQQSTTQNVPSFYQSTTQNAPRFYQSTTQKVPSFVLEESNKQQYSPQSKPTANVDARPTIRIGNQQALGNGPNVNEKPVEYSNTVAQPNLNSLQGIRDALLAEKVEEPRKNVRPQSAPEIVYNTGPQNASPERVAFQPIVVNDAQPFQPTVQNVASAARAHEQNVFRQSKVIDANQQVNNRQTQQQNGERQRQRPVRRRRPKPRPVTDEHNSPIDRHDTFDSREATTHVPLHRSRYFHSLHTWQDGETVRTFGEKIRQRRLPQGEKSLPDIAAGPISPAGFARGPRGITARHLTQDTMCSFPFHGYECNHQNVGERVKREEKRVFTGQGRATEPEEEKSTPAVNRDEKHVQKIHRRTRPTVVKEEKVVVTEKSVEKEPKKEEKRVFTGQGSISPPEDEEEEKKHEDAEVTTTEDPQVVYQRGIDEEQKRRDDDLKARAEEQKRRDDELKRRDEEAKLRIEEDERRAAAAKIKAASDKTTENPHIVYEKGIAEEKKRREEEQKRRDIEEVRREEEAERRRVQEIEVEKELERRKIQQKLVDEELERRKEERERTMIEEERRKKIKELEDD